MVYPKKGENGENERNWRGGLFLIHLSPLPPCNDVNKGPTVDLHIGLEDAQGCWGDSLLITNG